MEWLVPSLVATISTTLLVSFVFFYLFYVEEEKALLIWGTSWLTYSLRFVIHLSMVQNFFPPWMVVGQQVFSIVSGFLFVWGSHLFFNKRLSSAWMAGSLFCCVWTISGYVYKFSFLMLHLPAAIFIGFIYLWSGLLLLKNNQALKGSGRIAGWSLILWGIHKADYPFLRSVLWFAPWGYLIASVLFLSSAIGILLVYYEEQRGKLQKEIEERKQAEENLRLQSEIINRMTEGVYLLRRDGTIVYTNPKFEEMFGYDPGEMIGKQASIINYPTQKNPEETAREILDILDKKGVWQGEIKNIKKDGTPFWCYASVIAFDHSRYGKVSISVHTDISELRRMAAEKTMLEKQLQQAQKMEAIGTLAGGIAHDFNNILGAIMGYAEMAREDTPSESTVAGDLDEILKAAYRARDLVKQILTFSRQADAERIPIQPEQIIKEAVKMLRSSLPTTIEIHAHVDPVCGLIQADPTQIHQLLMNLCTNAFHAMEETGGELFIGLKNVTLNSKAFAEKQGILEGAFVELSVCDTGPGIDASILNKIFEPYFTTKEIGRGTGMGLAIVHGIVKSCGGAITVENNPGKGSTFRVFFPVIETNAVLDEKKTEEIPVGTERILFVDDEKVLAQMGTQILKRLGYKMTTMTKSLEALALFQNQPENFDLVITDQTMPEMTGAELARQILEIRPGMPIILCTGHSTIMSEETAKIMGIREFAMKPLIKKEIAHLIRKVLDTF